MLLQNGINSVFLWLSSMPLRICTALWFLFVCFFGGPHLRPMEVPRLRVELELQLPAYTSAIDRNVESELRLRPTPQLMVTHGARPGIKPVSSWI